MSHLPPWYYAICDLLVWNWCRWLPQVFGFQVVSLMSVRNKQRSI